LNSPGVAQREVRAAELATTSANAGESCGQQLLGSMYMRGQGVPRDLEKGIQLTRLAADKGYAAALFDLGLYYESGQGVTQDFVRARTY
ncbi:tetratricopeptide repeat protein, partial [Klebsiella pneumoniae]|uniref:tetratricopeptide repeat protein n=1 Tax=Klebsiella pneumoniae TaxID=573 RepID=UPI0013D5F06C